MPVQDLSGTMALESQARKQGPHTHTSSLADVAAPCPGAPPGLFAWFSLFHLVGSLCIHAFTKRFTHFSLCLGLVASGVLCLMQFPPGSYCFPKSHPGPRPALLPLPNRQ
ncbi:hypothetical protein VULLAG_LOCUS14286 [Vulpes lagopus]